MDLRFSYDKIKDEIDRAYFSYLDNDSLLVRDIKRSMHAQVDAILELEKEKLEIDQKIKGHRNKLKTIAEKWEI
jgi:hypothetical protein